MEHQRNELTLPVNHAFDLPIPVKLLQIGVATTVEERLKREERDPALVGVALFELDANCRILSPWVPTQLNSRNKAMEGSYAGVDFANPCDGALVYCESLLKASGISYYLQRRGVDFKNHTIVVHLHYWRRRQKPDQGFHKDTRGQTLFFMLHFLNDLPIFGPEWVRDRGSLVKVRKSGKRVGGERSSPALVDGVWPEAIREDVIAQKSSSDDERIHVARVGTYGAVLVVDDNVHHRTPNAKSRLAWGNKRKSALPQVSTVQAYNAEQKNGYYEIPRGRRQERGPATERGRSRSRSVSREREKKESGDPESTALWNATFDDRPRRFFRIWITVSPKDKQVWY